VPG
jgi:serine/threonine protein kinase